MSAEVRARVISQEKGLYKISYEGQEKRQKFKEIAKLNRR